MGSDGWLLIDVILIALDSVGFGEMPHAAALRSERQRSFKTAVTLKGISQTLVLLRENFRSPLFTNLADFDMLYGHRIGVEGYATGVGGVRRHVR